MSMRANGLRLLVLLASLLALGGCTKGTADLHQWVNKEKARKAPPLPPLPVIKTFETFVYRDQGKRDPFGPGLEEQRSQVKSGPRPDRDRPKQPLEAFALDSLRMVGTLGTSSSFDVLIRDPNGVIHRVHVNDYMGRNYGRVTDIGADHVDLVEMVPNGAGGWRERKAKIVLGRH